MTPTHKAELVQKYQAFMRSMESAAAAENNFVELVGCDIFFKSPIHGSSINVTLSKCDDETASLLQTLFEEGEKNYPQFDIKIG